MKICKLCHQEYPLTCDYWYKRNHNSDGFSNTCKKCYKENGYLEKKRENVKAYAKRHPEKVKERYKRWRDNNLEYHQELNREWKKKNRKRATETQVKKWTLQKQAEGNFTEEEIAQLYVKQGGKCHHCQCDLNNTFDRDHWIPITKGGNNYIENIRLMCSKCNCSKYNKLPWEWDDRYLGEKPDENDNH